VTRRSPFRALLRDVATDLLTSQPTVTVSDIVDLAMSKDPVLYDDEIVARARRDAENEAAQILRRLTEDDDDSQLTLPGLELPTAICLPNGEGPTEWILTAKANWRQLQIGRDLRVENIAHAQAALDRYDTSLRRLEPIMAHQLDMIVLDALAELDP